MMYSIWELMNNNIQTHKNITFITSQDDSCYMKLLLKEGPKMFENENIKAIYNF